MPFNMIVRESKGMCSIVQSHRFGSIQALRFELCSTSKKIKLKKILK
jgi:hypothetical protein